MSLGFWIVPLVGYQAFFLKRKLIRPNQRKAIIANIAALAVVGVVLDLFFARNYFVFPDRSMTIGWDIAGIPVEEFVFYITGFWFILFTYVWCDEYFLAKYNVEDREYYEYANREARRLLSLRFPLWNLAFPLGLIALFTGLKQVLNRNEILFPSYVIFLTVVAYLPFFFVWRIAKPFINFRALFLTLAVTVLISIIWEVTLAIPRGYWDYDHRYMLGIFISPWHRLPVEAVSVWGFSMFIVLTYEFSKVLFFRDKKPAGSR